MPTASPSNPRKKAVKLWQCVSIAMDDGRYYAGYIFKKKDSRGRYSVSIPGMEMSTKATEDRLTPRMCSENLKRKIAAHKEMLRYL